MMVEEALQSRAKLPVTSELVEEMLIVRRYSHGGAAGDSTTGNGSEDLQPLGQPRWDPSIANITITVFASVIIFCTLAGNALVITAVVKERRLRKVSDSCHISRLFL